MGGGANCRFWIPYCIDPGTSALIATPTPGPVSVLDTRAKDATVAMESEALNFGMRFTNDWYVRANYFREIKKMSEDILDRVASGAITPAEGAAEANIIRNSIMEASRLQSSEIGAAAAFKLKNTGKTLEGLQEEGALKKFGRSFEELEESERNEVLLGIIESAGRSRASVTAASLRLGRLGKGLVVLSIAIAIYQIATAEDKLKETVRVVGETGGGITGGALGGAAAGLVCGPGAPFCSGVGILVGGALGALGVDRLFDWIDGD
jgi:hypothetical protein